jgi:D-3-phosphoglycerate dehydrogenase / 2-oxoglutarate reductase
VTDEDRVGAVTNLVWNDLVPRESIALVADLVPPGVLLSVREEPAGPPPGLAVADLVLASGRYRVDADLLDAAPRLSAVIKFGSGIEILDVEELTRRGIPVYNTLGANAIGVAEHAVALVLSVMRHLTILDHRVRRLGHFDKWEYRHRSRELAGRTVGIVGFGAVGQAIASRLRGFEVDVVAAGRREIDTDVLTRHGARQVELPDLLRGSDVIILSVPLNDTTRHLIDGPALATMRPGAYLVNVARGEVVDAQAVRDALRSGTLGGFATDVFATEPPERDDPLFAYDNVVVTPHTAGATVETFRRVVATAMDHVARLQRGDEPDPRFRVC